MSDVMFIPAGWLRVSASRPGGRGFEPQPGHTKDFIKKW
jgi:hypothetical protein